MSRSRRKTPVIGMTTARSDKPYKVDAHRRERRALRTRLLFDLEDSGRCLHPKLFGDPWRAPKDGRQMVDPDSKWVRK